MVRSLARYMLDRIPYIRSWRAEARAAGAYPAGHFYSPIPDQTDVVERLRATRAADMTGVVLCTEQQGALLKAFGAFYREMPFPQEAVPGCRYYFNQTSFCYADAIYLYSFLRHFQPQRIIEVGSGFSSAVMVDTVERFFPQRPEITLVEPYPYSVKRLLRSEEWQYVTLIEDKVQHVPLERFASLQTGDLLFIDSSHVMKCGSDLQFLMCEILPRLPVGVFVHFHDVFDGFEYPAEWLLRGVYWNEDYYLRAFLSYNRAWEIVLFGNYAARVHRKWLAEHMPLCLENPGGSLYIRRVSV